MGNTIRFCTPSGTVPISVTDRSCALDCAHCGRRYLSHMVPLSFAANDPRVARAASVLISGGCSSDGRVPVLPSLPAAAALRAGRRFNWHLGLVSDSDVAAVAPLADVVSFDFPGDDLTIREVYGLDRSVEDYVASYRRLRASLRVVPHVTIGLHGGEIRGEYAALERLAALGVDTLVLLVLIPTRGTRYADRRPPALEDVLGVLQRARHLLPQAELVLGCMRPGGPYRAQLDLLALSSGIDCIVNPSAPARRHAAEAGLAVRWSHECCVF